VRGVLERGEQGDEAEAVDGLRPGLEKTRFFFIKTQPSGFFWVFFCFFYICAQKREEFLGFFQFQEYF
jgi:hypothetical protein